MWICAGALTEIGFKVEGADGGRNQRQSQHKRQHLQRKSQSNRQPQQQNTHTHTATDNISRNNRIATCQQQATQPTTAVVNTSPHQITSAVTITQQQTTPGVKFTPRQNNQQKKKHGNRQHQQPKITQQTHREITHRDFHNRSPVAEFFGGGELNENMTRIFIVWGADYCQLHTLLRFFPHCPNLHGCG